MRNPFQYLVLIFMLLGVIACSDSDSFPSSPNSRLVFSSDTLRLDTVFSTIQSSTKTLWVYNRGNSNIHCNTIRLENGNQTGFQVNVDGISIGKNVGYQTSEIDVRAKDSIRIFVKFLGEKVSVDSPMQVKDNLIFVLDNGREERLQLETYVWNANIIRQLSVKNDTTISTTKPTVVYGGIDIAEGSTLTIAAGTTLYFHGDAGINVNGRLICNGTADKNVVLRGDRLDKLFENLPYDRVSGQWKGIKINSSSYGNVMNYTDVHSAFDGIKIDSSNVATEKLFLNSCRIHNNLGYGLYVNHSKVRIQNTEITNSEADCLYLKDGDVDILASTIAQFYPFNARRGYAVNLLYRKANPLTFKCDNCIITGFSDDVFNISTDDKDSNLNNITISNTLLRTPTIDKPRGMALNNIMYEDVKDTISYGEKNFKMIDLKTMFFDFSLKEKAKARNNAFATTLPSNDRRGESRVGHPDLGAFIYKED
ncbi:hypothetical protein [Hoylesella nanceiensis]|jgi:lipoprotein|uniref:hypothetical protein n=1 Tax=Hoylesella nanceiensis TaxID=425941 RepID=UPI001CB0F485|nr:hypothetical protein [Hoylesella nanceiensis]MBF1427774.1 hypothetical protein [Hoylesella nanceiensis]